MFRWKDKQLKDVDAKKITKNSAAYITLGLAVLAMTFFGVCDPDRGGTSLTGSAAKVGDEVVSSRDFRRAYSRELDQTRQRDPDGVEAGKYNISGSVVQALVDERIFYENIKNLGIFVSEDEIIDYILSADAFKDDNGKFNQKNFENFLKYQRYTEKGFQDVIKRELAGEKYRTFISETFESSDKMAKLLYEISETKMKIEFVQIDSNNIGFKVSKEAIDSFLTEEGKKKVKEYYESNKDDFSTNKKVKAKHILVGFEGARNITGEAAKRSKEEAKKKAQTILAEVKKDKKSFSELAKKYTDEPSGKVSGGDLGYFEKDAMVEQFSNVAFSMEKGAISDIVESPFGFHIIMVDDINPAIDISFEEATPIIAEKLIRKDKIDALVENSAKNVLETLKEGKPLDSRFKWEETFEFPLTASYLPKIGMEPEVINAALSLKKEGEVYPKVLDVKGKKYIIKLKSIKVADFAKLPKSEQEKWHKNGSRVGSFSLVRSYNDMFKDRYNKQGKIWVNAKFRDWDANVRRQQQQTGS